VGIAHHIHESHRPLDLSREEIAQHASVFGAVLNVVVCCCANSLAWRGGGIIALHDEKATQQQETHSARPGDPIQE